MRSPPMTDAPLLLQAHRGAGFLEADNTVEAVELGWSLGMVPEIDVNTAGDGTLVSFHDHDLARAVRDLPADLAGRTIHQVPWERVADFDVGRAGAPRRVPLVRTLLERCAADPRRRLYLDIKTVDFARLAALVRAAGVARQVIFSTNRDAWIADWLALMPGSETLRWVWMDDAPQAWVRAEAELAALCAAGWPGITQLQLHLVPRDGGLHPGIAVAAALAAELAARGILFQAFPHSADPAHYAALHAAGVRSFASDDLHEMRRGLGLA